MTQSRSDWGLWACGALVLGAFLIRVYHLDAQSLWQDEIVTVTYSQGNFGQALVNSMVQFRASAPLHYLIVNLTALHVSLTEGMLRLPDVLWGTLSVAVTFLIGRRLFGIGAALLGTFLLAILPLHVYYSREMRFYSLATFFGVLIVFTLIRALERRTPSAWRWYGIAVTGGLLTYYYDGLIIAAAGVWVWLLWRTTQPGSAARSRRRTDFYAFLRATAAAILIALIWAIPEILTDDPAFAQRFTFPTMPPVMGSIATPFLFHLTAPFYADMPFYPGGSMGVDPLGSLWAVFAWISIMVGSMIALNTLRRSEWGRSRESHLLLMGAIGVGGIGVVLILNYVMGYFWSPRQFVIFAPFLTLTAAGAVTLIGLRLNRPRTQIRLILLVAAILSLILLRPALEGVFEVQKEDWRGGTRYIQRHWQPGDVLFALYREAHTLLYAPEWKVGEDVLQLSGDSAPLEAAFEAGKTRLWLFYLEVYPPKPLEGWINEHCERQTKGIGVGVRVYLCLAQEGQ
ncbi:MAG: glycosyltransferase family 39 protein [Anaerolineae bacterium]|nr:glycosyltransferase family 39 protein [Anaerolineae bacterium]